MKIVLRKVEIEDNASIVRWRNSIKVVNHCLDKAVITEESNRKFFEDMIKPGKYVQYIVERYEDEYGGFFSYQIGTIYFKDIDKNNKKCELGLFPGDDDEWNSEAQGEALKQMINIAFNEMNIHKIYSYVYADLDEEISLFKRSGFSIEGKLTSEIFDGEGYRDVLRLAIIN